MQCRNTSWRWVPWLALAVVGAAHADGETVRTADLKLSWSVGAWAESSALADGLPVQALDKSNWFQGLRGIEHPSRAAQRVEGGVRATHPSGWQFGWVGRSQVTLLASGDAVELAALNASGQDPANGRVLSIQAQTLGWTGQGLSVATPWWPVASKWGVKARVQGQWMQLSKLRHNSLAGQVAYQGGGAYDARLQTDRVGAQMTGPFLAASDAHGWGAGLSLGLSAEPAEGWKVALRADDLWSRLAWGRLARETSVLNTQVTTRAADGTLDFAPLVKGQHIQSTVSAAMGARWSLSAARAVNADAPQWGRWSARWTRWAGMDERWLTWFSRATPQGVQWQLAAEPWRRAWSGGAQWRGLVLSVASDGSPGASTAYRAWSLSWNTPI